LKISPDKQGLQKQQNQAITAAPTNLESLGVTSYAAKYQVYLPFFGNRRGGQVETVSISGGTMQEIAGLREQYNIGAVDWGGHRCIRDPQPILKQCQTRIAHSGAA
jgi:hypothetical protein